MTETLNDAKAIVGNKKKLPKSRPAKKEANKAIKTVKPKAQKK